MFMLYIFCSRKRKAVSYLQYVYFLDFVYQQEGSCIIPTIGLCSKFCVWERWKLYHKCSILYYLDILNKKEGNCIKPTVCLWSRLCLSERGKLYHAYNMFMFYILCFRNRETVSYTHHVYDIAYQKEGKCVIPSLYLCSRFFASESGELYHTYNIVMF